MKIRLQKSLLTQNDKKFQNIREEINSSVKDFNNNNELVKKNIEKCLKESQETLTTSLNQSREDMNKIVKINEKELTNTLKTITEKQNSKLINLAAFRFVLSKIGLITYRQYPSNMLPSIKMKLREF